MSRKRADINNDKRGLYTVLDHVVVRAPLLPIDAYLALGDQVATDQPSVLRALAVGSPDLFDALERSGSEGPFNAAIQSKLLRYLIRMSSRATPYGLFAGAQLARWGPHTDIALAPDGPRTRTRPDMEWLYRLVFALESRPEIRRDLRFVAARTVLVLSGRAVLHSQAPAATITAPDTAVSIRATKAVLKALDTAQTPVPYRQLYDELLAMPGATPAKVEHLITQLWEQTFLLTDLRPPMTIPNPAEYVAQRLENIPAAQQDYRRITDLLDAMSSWDRTPLGQAAAAHRGPLDFVAQPPIPGDGKHSVQVDMAHVFAGNQICAAVGAEAAAAAELLLRLTPLPLGLPHITAYRQSFEHRYGTDCEVPLLEMLDPDAGLGSPYRQPVTRSANGQFHSDAIRQRILREIALDAMRRRIRSVHLDDTMLTNLQTWSCERATAPASLDIPVLIAADSATAIDAGEFRIVVGPNVGAVSAGQSLGRFADMLGADAATALRNIAEAERAHDPQALSAELTYLPYALRSANVAIRPHERDHEIACGTIPAAMEQAIPPDELMVGVRDGRFRIRWSRTNADVRVHTGHMLNTVRAPGVCRFLSDARHDGIAQLSGFHWGTTSDFPFLPRIERGRIVLSLAQWRLDARLPTNTTEAFAAAFDQWREAWQVPRHVYLAAGDNRLLIDLDDAGHVAELRAEARRAQQIAPLVLQEALPGPGDAWLPGPGGHYVTELVVSVALRSASDAKHSVSQQDRTRPWRLRPVVSRNAVLRPAGSDWLFVKLYGPPAEQDEFLVGSMRAFCEAMRSSGLTQDWFFLRYSDPDPHLRLRFRGDPETLTTEVLPQLCSWSLRLIGQGTLTRMCVDTYEREIHRYGGPEAIEAAESLFAADSATAIDLLQACQHAQGTIDRTVLSMLNIDSLLAALGLDASQRIDWYAAYVTSRSESGSEYRDRKTQLRRHLGGPPDALAEVFSTRNRTLKPVRACLNRLLSTGELDQPLDRLLASFVHMSCNRLSGPLWPSEQRTLGLLLRTRTALRHAPA
jgi:thiopeptide-type bacteriocin biosynthesis protein